jgi:hypothetical protein
MITFYFNDLKRKTEITKNRSFINEVIEFFINKAGNFHRKNGPAVIMRNGNKFWFNNGDLHRKNGPAVVTRFKKVWYRNGKIINLEYIYPRPEGEETMNDFEDIFYLKDGLLHRNDGPALIQINGKTCWYKNGDLHRFDGPALISPIFGIREYYINGKCKSFLNHLVFYRFPFFLKNSFSSKKFK